MDTFKRDQNHILVRRKHQSATLNFKTRNDLLMPDDDVNNGGYLETYQILTPDQLE